ncbi:MAG TPA: hypothetical protein VI322_04255 [Candidatus Saccharimonadia bacterium]
MLTTPRRLTAASLGLGLALPAGIQVARNLTTRRHDVPHTERRIQVGCFDGRLSWAHFVQALNPQLGRLGTLEFEMDFTPRLPGGGAGFLTPMFQEPLLVTVEIGHSVNECEEVVVQVHLGCAYIQHLRATGACLYLGPEAEPGPLWSSFNPADAADMMSVATHAASVVAARFQDMPIRLEVVKIIRGWHGLLTTSTVMSAPYTALAAATA